MASIVPCVHSACATYPNSTPLSSTYDVIQLTLLRHEFHCVKYHPSDDDDIQEITTSYEASKPPKSHMFNPFCGRCEATLLKHLTVGHRLPYCSADKALQTIRELLHQKHIELEDTKAMYPNTRRFERLSYKLNYYFDKALLSDKGNEYDDETGGFTPALWKVTKTLVQVDDDWDVYFLA